MLKCIKKKEVSYRCSEFPYSLDFTSWFLLNLTITKLTIMKKSLIAAMVGGIIIFLWQFLSWTILNLHQPAQKYTAKQDAVMTTLSSNLEEGGYYLPSIPESSSWAEHEKAMTESVGKPWATIQYHKALEDNMT